MEQASHDPEVPRHVCMTPDLLLGFGEDWITYSGVEDLAEKLRERGFEVEIVDGPGLPGMESRALMITKTTPELARQIAEAAEPLDPRSFSIGPPRGVPTADPLSDCTHSAWQHIGSARYCAHCGVGRDDLDPAEPPDPRFYGRETDLTPADLPPSGYTAHIERAPTTEEETVTGLSGLSDYLAHALREALLRPFSSLRRSR